MLNRHECKVMKVSHDGEYWEDRIVTEIFDDGTCLAVDKACFGPDEFEEFKADKSSFDTIHWDFCRETSKQQKEGKRMSDYTNLSKKVGGYMEILKELNKTNKKIRDEAIKSMEKWAEETKTAEDIYSNSSMQIRRWNTICNLHMQAGSSKLIDRNSREELSMISLKIAEIREFILKHKDRMIAEIENTAKKNLSESNEALLKIIKGVRNVR